jgi:cation diffusion facilitator CzcD-associated flavoprotein CzcO
MLVPSKSLDAGRRAMTLTRLAEPEFRSRTMAGLPVAVIGAGPVGLAAAAHLAERGLDFVVLEAGDDAGAAIESWGHTRLFSPWSLLVDPAAARLLAPTGWAPPPPDTLPTGAELVRDYLRPLAELDSLRPSIRYGARVTAVSREGMDRTRSIGRRETPFVLRVAGADGTTELAARAVIDASGTSATPNGLSSDGLDPLGIEEARDAVTPALPDVLGRDRARFAGRRVVVVGAGHSAANTLLALARLADVEPGTTVTWVIRNAGAVRVSASDDDGLPARATLGAAVDALVASGAIDKVDRFELAELRRDGAGPVSVIGRRSGQRAELAADVVVNATGFRPDLAILRELRLGLDEVVEAPRLLAPLIDPNIHSCGTVEPHGYRELQHPEPNFYLAGMKSYGRAPTFLLATGYEQVRSIVAAIDGDLASAESVELILPATGVCSTELGPADASCCS